MWLECRFLDTEVGGSNPGSTVCCVLEQDTLSAFQSHFSCEMSTRWRHPREGYSVL